MRSVPDRAVEQVANIMNIDLRHIAVFPIRFYQCVISPFLPASCRFVPSCSAYAVEAVLQHGVFKGSTLALRRILRCNPLCPGGYDPVPGSEEQNADRVRS